MFRNSTYLIRTYSVAPKERKSPRKTPSLSLYSQALRPSIHSAPVHLILYFVGGADPMVLPPSTKVHVRRHPRKGLFKTANSHAFTRTRPRAFDCFRVAGTLRCAVALRFSPAASRKDQSVLFFDMLAPGVHDSLGAIVTRAEERVGSWYRGPGYTDRHPAVHIVLRKWRWLPGELGLVESTTVHWIRLDDHPCFLPGLVVGPVLDASEAFLKATADDLNLPEPNEP